MYVASGIVGTVVNFGAILVLVVWMKIGLHGLFISYILSQVATFFTIELKLHLLGGIRIRRDSLGLLKKMAIFSAPLTLNSISGWLFTGFSRVVINSRLGTYENGLYAFANKFAIVISMLGTVITMAVVEEAIIASKDKSKSASEGKNTSELYVAVISVATAVIPAIKLFYDLIAESEYYSSFIYVPFLLLYASLITLASNIGAQFQALEITKYQFITTVIGSAVTVALSLIFVDRYGVIAVIIAQVVGAVVMAISRYVIVKRYIPYKMGWLKMLLSTAVYVILSILCLNATPLIACLLMLLAIIAMAAFNYKVILAFVKRKKTTDQV